jgi:pimeloyl-ACP methyl ester carboxylesterase
MGLFKGMFKIGLVAGAAVGIGYLAERALLAKLQENPDPDPEWRPATPEGETARVGTADGSSMRAVRAGSGPPIVLIHGLMVPIDVWSLVFSEFVDAGHEVIAYDLRGHGGSGVGSEGFGMDQYADDLKAILEHYDLRNAVVVAHSMGAMGAMTFAVRHPDVARERLAGMVVAATSPGGVFELAQNKAQLALLQAGLAQRLIESPVHGPLLARPYFGPRPRFSQIKALNAMHAATDPETTRQAPLSMVDYDLRDRLDEIEVPTMVLHGSEDMVTPPEGATLIAEGIPGARLVWMHGIGHMMQFEAPGEFVDRAVDFAKERQLAAN